MNNNNSIHAPSFMTERTARSEARDMVTLPEMISHISEKSNIKYSTVKTIVRMLVDDVRQCIMDDIDVRLDGIATIKHHDTVPRLFNAAIGVKSRTDNEFDIAYTPQHVKLKVKAYDPLVRYVANKTMTLTDDQRAWLEDHPEVRFNRRIERSNVASDSLNHESILMQQNEQTKQWLSRIRDRIDTITSYQRAKREEYAKRSRMRASKRYGEEK